MKLSVCQLPDGLSLDHHAWADLLRRIELDRPDLAILNEMPFGPWIATRETFDPVLAQASVQDHERALPALLKLPTPILSSRPVPGPQKLSNEAFLISAGRYQPIHHKHFFPQEPGFFEDAWFAPQLSGFNVIEHPGLKIGVLLCTELMFNEWARHYRRQGAHVIVVPRASGASRKWDTAAAMAAIVSGCYVLSSNRAPAGNDPDSNFGGRGFVFSPAGELLAQTSPSNPLVSVDIDLGVVAEAQRAYPCYVREL
ncbi:MAG TPA: carbon-nitrogen hydrolase family protein [Candidatus Acidoferrum sp.]|nr:carbon-nitrogen hydrolase family protein [Candidatus Acidoferrum sp.]